MKRIKCLALVLAALVGFAVGCPAVADSLTPSQVVHVKSAMHDIAESKETTAEVKVQLGEARAEIVKLQNACDAIQSEYDELANSWRVLIGTWLIRMAFCLALGFILGLVAAVWPGPYGYILSLISLVLMAVGSGGITLLPQMRDNLYFLRTHSYTATPTTGN